MYSTQSNGIPAWLIFLLATAFVFGGYYLWLGVRSYMATGGLSVAQATERAELSTATAVQQLVINRDLPTRRPTNTPIPDCQNFVVRVPTGVVRQEPTINSDVVEYRYSGDPVCVLSVVAGTDWFLIDVDPETRPVDTGYMRNDIIRSLNPTTTPTSTAIPPPTITPTPSRTPSITPTVDPQAPAAPAATQTATPVPSITPTPTLPSVSL